MEETVVVPVAGRDSVAPENGPLWVHRRTGRKEEGEEGGDGEEVSPGTFGVG